MEVGATGPVAPGGQGTPVLNLFLVRPTGFNVGNELIAYVVRRMLRRHFGDTINLITVPATVRHDDGWYAGLTARAIHQMNLYAHGVVVGGGNLYENGQLDVDVHALGRLRPPLLLFSLSYGRIYDQRGRLTPRTDSMPDDVIIELNRQAGASLVRDEATLAYLQDLGIGSAVLTGCPTLFLDEMVTPQSERRPPSDVLISVRSPELMSVPLAHQARARVELRGIVDRLRACGMTGVRLLCHDKRDLAFAESMGDLEYVLPDDVNAYVDILRQARLVVTFRLHAFVPCLSLGTPTVNISYDERSLSLVRTLGLDTWDIDFIREPDVGEVVMDRVARLPDLSTLITRVRPKWEDLRLRMCDAIAAFAKAVLGYAAEGPGKS